MVDSVMVDKIYQDIRIKMKEQVLERKDHPLSKQMIFYTDNFDLAWEQTKCSKIDLHLLEI